MKVQREMNDGNSFVNLIGLLVVPVLCLIVGTFFLTKNSQATHEKSRNAVSATVNLTQDKDLSDQQMREYLRRKECKAAVFEGAELNDVLEWLSENMVNLDSKPILELETERTLTDLPVATFRVVDGQSLAGVIQAIESIWDLKVSVSGKRILFRDFKVEG
ncbi:MAG: hypothetical protein AAF591_23060 [Verrucomicrobiota bacterium]